MRWVQELRLQSQSNEHLQLKRIMLVRLRYAGRRAKFDMNKPFGAFPRKQRIWLNDWNWCHLMIIPCSKETGMHGEDFDGRYG